MSAEALIQRATTKVLAEAGCAGPGDATGGSAPLEPKETTVANGTNPGGAAQRDHLTEHPADLRPQGGARGGTAPSADQVAVAPPGSADAFALRMLGVDTDGLEQRAHTNLRRKAVAWAAGLLTPGGTDRGRRIAGCGQVRPAMGAESGQIGLCQLRCRDRACPSCQRARSRQLGHRLRAAVQHRQQQAPDARLLFVTLTLPKVPLRECGATSAVARTMAAWQALSKSNTKRGRAFRERFAGGVRTVEVTFSARGDVHGEHVVEYDGYHVHLHILVELADGTDGEEAVAWLLGEWCGAVVPGAREEAQKVVDLDMQRVGQLTKYVTKPLEDAASRPHIARELFAALHGRRLIHGFGSWKDWKKWVEEDDDGDAGEVLLVGQSSLGEVERQTRPGLLGRYDYEVVFTGWVGGGVAERVVPGVDVWDAIEADSRTFAERRRQARANDMPHSSSSPARVVEPKPAHSPHALSDPSLSFQKPDVRPFGMTREEMGELAANAVVHLASLRESAQWVRSSIYDSFVDYDHELWLGTSDAPAIARRKSVSTAWSSPLSSSPRRAPPKRPVAA